MNSIRSLSRAPLLLVWVLACHATAFSAANQPPTSSPTPGGLQVQVHVPLSWRPMFEDRITQAFVSNIADVFRRQGYKGQIVEVLGREEPDSGSSLLVINLTEWRMNYVGNIDCTFTANLQTGRATRHLGVFSAMAFRWMSGPGRFGLADAFTDAAEDAIRQLYSALARTELVPGLRN